MSGLAPMEAIMADYGAEFAGECLVAMDKRINYGGFCRFDLLIRRREIGGT